MTRKDAVEHLKEWKECISSGYRKAVIDMAIEALQFAEHFDLLKEYQSLQEVVRCKDCRWYDNRYGDVCHNPRYGDGWANYPPPYVDEDYFCKDGERKGGDDE